MKIKIKYALLLINVFSFHCQPFSEKFIGPARITIKRMEKCKENIEEVKSYYEIKRVNRTHQGVTVTVESVIEFGNQVKINFTVEKWGDGGWKPHVLDMYEDDACEFFMKYGKKQLINVLKELKLPLNCPIKPGKYSVVDFIYDGDADIPLLYGDFKVKISFIHKGDEKLCVLLFVKSDPKIS